MESPKGEVLHLRIEVSSAMPLVKDQVVPRQAGGKQMSLSLLLR